MSRWTYLFLALFGFLISASVALFQPASSYMDADYYYAGGLQLAAGRGFSEPYLWNYLDDPAGLPHPSHAYWMPLASILAAAGMALAGQQTWAAARIGFLVVAACLPPLTAAVSYALTSRRDLAFLSGLLAAFPAFYLPFLSQTESFGLYMLFGGLFVLVVGNKRLTAVDRACSLGVLAGLFHLARADGVLWLALAFVAILLLAKGIPFKKRLAHLGLCLAGYLLIMGPWFARNYAVFGSLLAPGGSRALWLTSYDQTFAFPAGQLTFQNWLASGFAGIASARLWSLGLNLANALSVQGGIFLLPLMLVGLWTLRKDVRIQVAGLAWLVTLLVMTFIFPFAGARGGFFHSGAAVQPILWAVVPLGLERSIAWARRLRGWKEDGRAERVFSALLIVLVILLTGVIFLTRVAGRGSGSEQSTYRQVESFLLAAEAPADVPVIVANPPGYYLASGRPAIAVPDGDPATIRLLAERYGARYLVLEEGAVPQGLLPVYDEPEGLPGLLYLGEVEGARVYAIQP
jgi:hypothetical protein